MLQGALSGKIILILLYLPLPLPHDTPDSFVVIGGALGAEDIVIRVLWSQIWRYQIYFDSFADTFQSLFVLLDLLCVQYLVSGLSEL